MKKSILVAVTHTGNTATGLEAKLSSWIYGYDCSAELYFSNINPTYSNRNACVKYFLQTKHTHLLFIDSDTIPFKNPLKLIEHDKHIVGGVYPRWKSNNYEWLVMDRLKDGRYVQVKPEKRGGLSECDGLGAGCLMMTREVLESMKAPFKDAVDEEGIRSIGHDFLFCERAKKRGYKVFADWNILCDHIKLVPLVAIIKTIKQAYDNGCKAGKKE